jgi:hypothetical protein
MLARAAADWLGQQLRELLKELLRTCLTAVNVHQVPARCKGVEACSRAGGVPSHVLLATLCQPGLLLPSTSLCVQLCVQPTPSLPLML